MHSIEWSADDGDNGDGGGGSVTCLDTTTTRMEKSRAQ